MCVCFSYIPVSFLDVFGVSWFTVLNKFFDGVLACFA